VTSISTGMCSLCRSQATHFSNYISGPGNQHAKEENKRSRNSTPDFQTGYPVVSGYELSACHYQNIPTIHDAIPCQICSV
jgi:hypothetical protein